MKKKGVIVLKKEFVLGLNLCIIRDSARDQSLQHVLDLFQEAKRDFPSLQPIEVNIGRYGTRSSYVIGIDFRPSEAVPDNYTHTNEIVFF